MTRAEKEGRPDEVRALLTRAVAAGTESVSIRKRLAEIEARAGNATRSKGEPF